MTMRDLKVLLLLCIFAPILFCKKGDLPEKDYLSAAYVTYQVRNQDKKHTYSEIKQMREKALGLQQQGFAAYKAKNDQEAVKHYEAALDVYVLPSTYYHYANSLSNIDRLYDSVKAYELALDLRYEQPNLALYNIACVYSRLQNRDKAMFYLSKAVARGYAAFDHIAKDPDLSFLREDALWEKRLAAMQGQDIEYAEADFIGRLEVPIGPRSPLTYFLCQNGTVVQTFPLTHGFNRGIWRLENGDINVEMKEACEYEGFGKTNTAGEGVAFEKERFLGCRTQDFRPDYRTHIALRSDEVRDMVTQSNSEQYTYGPPHITKFGTGENSEPPACDPSYVPTEKVITNWNGY